MRDWLEGLGAGVVGVALVVVELVMLAVAITAGGRLADAGLVGMVVSALIVIPLLAWSLWPWPGDQDSPVDAGSRQATDEDAFFTDRQP